MTVGVAILGGGIFVQMAHLPALQTIRSSSLKDAPGFALKAIWSRSFQSTHESAKVAFTTGLVESIDLFSEVGESAERKGTLEDLLNRDDIQAVIIALPITKQPAIIESCWKAGKHVISEKPVGPDIKSAKALIRTYNIVYKPKGVKWRVAENFESMPIFSKIPEMLAPLGKVINFSYVQTGHIETSGNKWHQTSWRTVPDYQGGFILDGGVHAAAVVLNSIAARSTASDIELVSFVKLAREHLPPVDTLHSIIKNSEGVQGTFEYTASGPPGIGSTSSFTIVAENGYLQIKLMDGELKVITPSKDASKGAGAVDEEVLKLSLEVYGVMPELLDFLKDCSGAEHKGYGSPELALRDLAFIEGLLGSNGRSVKMSELLS